MTHPEASRQDTCDKCTQEAELCQYCRRADCDAYDAEECEMSDGDDAVTK